MKTTTTLDSWSLPSSTMTSTINLKDTIFNQANLTPICGKPTFEKLHDHQNNINSNAKSIYSNLIWGAHVYLGLVLIDLQSLIISNTLFVYPTHLGPLIITDSTATDTNSNVQIMHTKEVHLFCKVMIVEQDLVKHIVATIKEAYLAYVRNITTNSINNAVADVLTHLQENKSQLMCYELLK